MDVARDGGVKSASPSTNTPTSTEVPHGTTTIPVEVFNLIKSIVGAGVLGLPAGIAAFGDAPSALIPAVALISFIGGFAAYGFSLIGLVCGRTKATTYRDAWSRSVSPRTAWMPAAACLMVTACSVLTYSMVLADTIPNILRAVAGISISRTAGLLGTTGAVLLPLCLMKSLSALAPFSLVGILGMLYTSLVMMLRYVTKSYAAGGRFVVAEHLTPRFGTAGWKSVFGGNAAILVSMLSTAFMAHYNAPRFYWDLKDNTMPRYNKMVGLSFAGSVLLMVLTAVAGFGTFGSGASPLILNNYAVTDRFMGLSRIAVAVSLIASYPLAFVGVKEGILSLFQVNPEKSAKVSTPLTLGLLAGVTGLAYVFKDIGIILALGGATWGNFVIYLAPAIMVIKAANKFPELKSERVKAAGTGVLGFFLAVVGTVRALQTM